MTPLFSVAVGFYACATVTYAIYLFGRGEGVLAFARWILGAALAAHLGIIGLLCTEHAPPLLDVRGALSLSGWLLGVGYLIAAVPARLGAVGALVSPLALMLLVAARLTPHGPLATTRSFATLAELHIGLGAVGVALLGLAAAVALIYLLQEAALKRKRFSLLFRRAPSLLALEQVGLLLLLFGFSTFTLAVVTGMVWVERLPRREGLRPEYVLSGIAWAVLGALVVGRLTVGWRGRRAAWATVFGFVAMVAVLGLYVGRRMLGG